MSVSLEQLAIQVAEMLDIDGPALLDNDAPVLGDDDGDVYLVGLIGGKDVGKSSFVNALVGREITEQSSHGRGTSIAVAYVHESRTRVIEELLQREAPGRFRIVTHRNDALARQALLDLPDIDSIYEDHLELTRRMLRHMLFPIWIASFEKYADQQPQRLLARVAQGNDPGNFLFCLNKIDLLTSRHGERAAEELRADAAKRLAKLLLLESKPNVHLISARESDRFDFPALRRTLSQQRSEQTVASSRQLAQRQRERSLLAWIDAQQLPAKLDRIKRLAGDAQELVASRIATLLLEEAVPKLSGDPGHRLSMIEPCVAKRLSRWPVVNVIQTVLSPIASLVSQNLSAIGPRSHDISAYVDEPLVPLIAGTFATLQQTQPAAAMMYRENKLWEPMHAEAAVRALDRRSAAILEKQRQTLLDRVAGDAWFGGVFRFLLTVGAILWFPIIQPITEALLQGSVLSSTRDLALLVVQTISVTYLLKHLGFLLIYFIALWAILRFGTHRKASRLLEKWNRDEESDLSLTHAVIDWTDDLLEPLTKQQQQLEAMLQQVDEHRDRLLSHAA
jgi:GTPase Era involved in 16S rRNA processing